MGPDPITAAFPSSPPLDMTPTTTTASAGPDTEEVAAPPAVVPLSRQVQEPVLASHLAALVVSLLSAAGVSTAWALDPGTMATLISLAGLFVSVIGHAAAWWTARGKVEPSPVTAVTLGRHSRPS
jgi:hypothetical protein